MQQREKVRVYILARELDIDTADLLRLCKQAGYDVKNQLSNLEPDQQQALEEIVKKASKAPAPATPAKPVTKVVLPDERAVPNLAARAPKREVEPEPRQPTVAEIPAEAPAPPPVEAPAVETPTVAEEVARPRAISSPTGGKVPVLTTRSSSPAAKSPAAPEPGPAPMKIEPPKAEPVKPAPPTRAPASSAPRAPQELGRSPAARDATKPGDTPARRSEQQTTRRSSNIPRHLQHLKPVPPPQLKQQPKLQDTGPKIVKPIIAITKEHIEESKNKPIKIDDLLRPPPVPVAPDETTEEDEAGKKDKKRAIPGREERQKKRNIRAEERKSASSQVKIVDGKVEVVYEEEVRAPRNHPRFKQKHKQVIKQRATSLELEPPLTIRILSEQLGIRSVELMFKLKDHGVQSHLTINSVVENDLAQIIALEYGCELTIKKGKTDEDLLLAGYETPDNPDDLLLRAPIVTVMGHVDHGKTSLLDKIRQSDVVATEAGGITQVIRAWRVEHGGKPVTFLDTPGHEAFTKMRARGAQVTDVAVIVVAADDGVMPQTEEAISHAKAAGVSLVIAINKIDMPSANINRTRQQLYGLNVLPDNMGGDTPFVETSAATGKGIDELLDQLAVVAELKELKANPKKAAKGTCLEAMLSEGEGVRATLLIRDGTLRRGDIILCGGTSGRVRQMYNDLGQPIDEAGPSVPVRITGLDYVPDAGDPFQVLPDLNLAADIAEKRRQKQRETTVTKRAPLTLERLTETKIDELKVILKADFRGSIEAIRKELDKLQHAEVRVRILEAGIGAITENDVWLALASPEDTMIVGFNAVPDDRALALSEERKVQIREYNIIYNLTNDIRAALEGKLKPREEVVHLGRAIVRDTFKISRVGTIAGCYITQGTIKRNAKIRVIREGVVIYPPPDRSAGLESLKRFKEDVGEVREGFECGIKVAGYDDIKVGDVIEAFRIEHVQRTLE
ncbi:MAG: translation initiation factor IF-2 [Planctomycetes bacterium]|nr:translation initiation factor IF-2 [Planctomycetota bacterium]